MANPAAPAKTIGRCQVPLPQFGQTAIRLAAATPSGQKTCDSCRWRINNLRKLDAQVQKLKP